MVALRPEKTLMTREKPDSDVNWSSGKVHDIAYLGGTSVYYVKLSSGRIVQASIANTERRGDRPTWDDPVYISWDDYAPVVLWD